MTQYSKSTDISSQPFEDRARTFLKDFALAAGDVDHVVHPGAGEMNDGRLVPAFVIEAKDKIYGFTTTECRAVAAIATSIIQDHPHLAHAFEGLPGWLLQVAVECEAKFTEDHSGPRH